MEWAWKPMAACMNENKTDLVYWVPPLYASNILNSFTSSSSASSPVSSLCSSPSLSRARNISRRSTLADVSTPLGSRRRRISKRRPLSQKQSIDEVGEELEMDEASAPFPVPNRNGQQGKFDGTIKKDLIVEFEAENIELVQGISEVSNVEDAHNKEAIKSKSRRGSRAAGEKPERKTRSMSILKLLEKVSHLHEKPKHRPIARRNAKIERTMSSGSQKIKRPSLKVYQNVPKHGSGRRATAPAIPTQPPETEAKEARMVITGKNSQGPRLSIRRASRQSSTRSRSASVTTTGLKVSQVTEAELRSAHLEMMIKILATLYEEKISKQDTEIKTLREKFKSQDKIVKQVVHNMLEVKAEVKSMKEHLIQHEEYIMQRNQQLIAQQSIPEEIEEDLEMFEIDSKHDSSNKSSLSGKDRQTVIAKMEEYIDSGHISDDVASAKSTTDDYSSISTVVENPSYGTSTVIDQEGNCVTADVISIDECQVLEPPDEYKSTDLDDPPLPPIQDSRLYTYEYTPKKIVQDEQQAILDSIKADLEAQDVNEYNLHYERIDPDVVTEDHVIDETFFAAQYVADYHPREEMRLSRAKECYFSDHLCHIQEDDRTAVLSRQRSDDSTNI